MVTNSFSSNAREEISRFYPEKKCCREALLASFLFSGFERAKENEKHLLEVSTGLSRTARLIYRLMKDISGENVNWEVKREAVLKKRNMYHIFAPDSPSMREYISRWGITGRLQKSNIRRACCRRSFLAGSFLGAGSVNSPEGNYHFEIAQRDPEIAKLIARILAKMEVGAKIVKRRNHHLIYVKKADEIVNVLNIMGAHMCLLKFEEIRAIKETKTEVRRRVNAETSNMDKTAQAAIRQIHCIKSLKKKGFLDNLPNSLKEVADLRLKFPEASLRDIGERLNPPLTKSSVNSRLRRLESISLSLEKETKNGFNA